MNFEQYDVRTIVYRYSLDFQALSLPCTNCRVTFDPCKRKEGALRESKVTLQFVHGREKEMRRKEERSKQGQTNNKAKQHSTPAGCGHLNGRL